MNQAFIRRVSFIAGLGRHPLRLRYGCHRRRPGLRARLVPSFHADARGSGHRCADRGDDRRAGGGHHRRPHRQAQNAGVGSNSFHRRVGRGAVVPQRLRAVRCPRAAGHRSRIYFGDRAGLCLRARSSAIARDAHRLIPVCPDLGHCPGGPGGLLVCRTAGVEADVCLRITSRGSFPLHGSYGAGESPLAVRAEPGGGSRIRAQVLYR